MQVETCDETTIEDNSQTAISNEYEQYLHDVYSDCKFVVGTIFWS
jgi:hypothetical protein